MKHLRLLSLLLILAIVAMSCGSGTNAEKKETKVAEEEVASANDGWVVLFDGTNTDNFRSYGKETFPEKGWLIEDGALKVQASGKGEAGGGGGDIISIKKYKNFELSLEWKISEGGNSGIFYLGQEIEGKPIYVSAPEMQILDNEKHPDAKLGKDGNRQAGSLYDLIPAVPQNAKPVGEWNQVKITVFKGTVIHNMNGENVLEYHLWTDEWKEMCANSKFKDWPYFIDTAVEGYIGLQDHGDNVWFRNIKIKEL